MSDIKQNHSEEYGEIGDVKKENCSGKQIVAIFHLYIPPIFVVHRDLVIYINPRYYVYK
jgi:hypothetical protein